MWSRLRLSGFRSLHVVGVGVEVAHCLQVVGCLQEVPDGECDEALHEQVLSHCGPSPLLMGSSGVWHAPHPSASYLKASRSCIIQHSRILY